MELAVAGPEALALVAALEAEELVVLKVVWAEAEGSEELVPKARFEAVVVDGQSVAMAVAGAAPAAASVLEVVSRSAGTEQSAESVLAERSRWVGMEQSASKARLAAVVYSADPLAATAVAEERSVPLRVAELRLVAGRVAGQAFSPMAVSTEAFAQVSRVGPVFVPVVDNCAPARHRSAGSRPAVGREVARAWAVPVPDVARCRLAEGPRCQVARRASSLVAGSHCRVDSVAAVFPSQHPPPVVVSMFLPSHVQRVLRRDLCSSKSFFPPRQL